MSANRKDKVRPKAARGQGTGNKLLTAALRYARRGWAVFPLNGKIPFPDTHGHKDATTDQEDIKEWWREWPDANIGVRCDSTAGPLLIDIDGPSGRDWLHEYQTRHGRLPPTLASTSGRPHRKHLWFAPAVNGERIKRTIKIDNVSLDVLGNGGYVVAPPSIHPKTGKPYRWLNQADLAPFPASLLDVAVRARDGARNNGARPGPAGKLPDQLLEGQRDDLLTSLAGSARRRGADEEEIFALLDAVNQRRCSPPLEDNQLRKIARSIGKKPPLPIDFAQPINDINLAQRFAQLECGELRYCPQWRRWLVWDGTRWAKDFTHEPERRIEAMVRGVLALLESVDDPKERGELFKAVNPYTRRRKLDDVLAVASRREELVITPDRLDADPWVFNVTNGTLDLRTGKLRTNDSNDLLTKLAPVAFDRRATAPLWNQFIADITRDQEELATYLQRAVGYTLVGVAQEHCLFFGHGKGSNGKTTFLETLYELFGDYATTIDFETLLHQRYGTSGEAHRDLPRLNKARFVMADEAPQNARWDERMVKKLTGGNTLSGRWLYQEKFDFQPTHTLWCQANDQPSAHDPSHAFWRRMKLIPFTRRFPDHKQNLTLKEDLVGKELPGILNWALAGCRAWVAAVEAKAHNRLAEPERVQRATAKYREEQDVVGEFIAARCAFEPECWTPLNELYVSFVDWWRETRGGRPTPLNSLTFGKALGKREQLRAVKRHNVRGWKGLALV